MRLAINRSAFFGGADSFYSELLVPFVAAAHMWALAGEWNGPDRCRGIFVVFLPFVRLLLGEHWRSIMPRRDHLRGSFCGDDA